MPVLDGSFEAFVTNLGKYNEGELVGEWVHFPTTEEEMKKVFERIGIGSKGEFGQVYEEWFKGLAWRFPTKVSANIKFSNQLAQRIYAASDIFLMPSNYEPCGIGQLIAMRYGAVPLVRETGGLKDTVQQYDKYTNTGNGFVFSNYNAHEMMYALKRALSAYENYAEWQHIVENAMKTDFSWRNSANEYKQLYTQLIAE